MALGGELRDSCLARREQRRSASWELTEADGSSCRAFGAAQAWVGTPDSVQIAWMGNFARDPYQGLVAQPAWPSASIR